MEPTGRDLAVIRAAVAKERKRLMGKKRRRLAQTEIGWRIAKEMDAPATLMDSIVCRVGLRTSSQFSVLNLNAGKGCYHQPWVNTSRLTVTDAKLTGVCPPFKARSYYFPERAFPRRNPETSNEPVKEERPQAE